MPAITELAQPFSNTTSNNVVTGNLVDANLIMHQVMGKGIGLIQPETRQYPLMSYVMFGPDEFYRMHLDIHGKNSDKGLQINKNDKIQFKELGNITPTLSHNGVDFIWYEGTISRNETLLQSDSSGADAVLEKIGMVFQVGDTVKVMPDDGSDGVLTYITAVDTGSNTITTEVNLNASAGDRLIKVSTQFNNGSCDTRRRESGKDEQRAVSSRIQSYGASVSFKKTEINRTMLGDDIGSYVAKKIAKARRDLYLDVVNTFFFGSSNHADGTDGLETVIAYREANSLESIKDLTGVAEGADMLRQLKDLIVRASGAPIYDGSNKPFVFGTTAAIHKITGALDGYVTYQNSVPKTIEYGLETISTPSIPNINFVASTEMDILYGSGAKTLFILPVHLIGFATYENNTIDEKGNISKGIAGQINIVGQNINTNHCTEFTMEYEQANLFGGRTIRDTYWKVLL